MRYNKNGDYVDQHFGELSNTDCEIVSTLFSHPTIKSGQHTNGPATFWIRMADGSTDWIRSRERSAYKTWLAWVELGIEWFQLVESEEQQ